MSNLKNTVFFDTLYTFKIDEGSMSTHIIDRPVTSILVHPDMRMISTPKAFMKLDSAAHSIPLRVTLQPQKLTKENVNAEVDQILKLTDNKAKESVSHQLIKNIIINEDNCTNTIQILKKAEKLSEAVDSFFLPGGEDIAPTLYGAETEDKTNWGGDYRRSILELGIIHNAVQKGIPLMGICRGFQMTNVYFGAQLIQDVDNQLNKPQKFTLDPEATSGLLTSALKSTGFGSYIQKNNYKRKKDDKREVSITGGSAHHQGIVKGKGEATQHLEGVITYDGLVKASQPKEGGAAPMVLLQFHPEFFGAETADSTERQMADFAINAFLSKNNDDIWTVLSDNGKAYRAKQKALEEISKGGSRLKVGDQKHVKVAEAAREASLHAYFKRKEKLSVDLLNNPKKVINEWLGEGDTVLIDNFQYSDNKEALIDLLGNDKVFIKKLIDNNRIHDVLAQLALLKGEDHQLFFILENNVANILNLNKKYDDFVDKIGTGKMTARELSKYLKEPRTEGKQDLYYFERNYLLNNFKVLITAGKSKGRDPKENARLLVEALKIANTDINKMKGLSNWIKLYKI